jgi:sugar-phosphatase
VTTAYLVAGAAGTGKSTLGAALAARTGAVLLDLDPLTNPLLDAVFAGSGRSGHWNDDRHRAVVRPARYAVLLQVAGAQVALGHDVVLVAPFTAELAGGLSWQRLVEAVAPAVPSVVWLHADPEVLTRRMRERGEARDAADRAVAPAQAPDVPHVAVDATEPTEAQLARIA